MGHPELALFTALHQAPEAMEVEMREVTRVFADISPRIRFNRITQKIAEGVTLDYSELLSFTAVMPIIAEAEVKHLPVEDQIEQFDWRNDNE